MARAETIALALSGGGARGFAHIGVLRALNEAHIEPDLIVGSSMGAVIGGLYAAGYTVDELENIALSTDWSNLFLDRPSRRNLFLAQKETTARHILSVRFRDWQPDFPLALSNGQKISEFLIDLVHRAPYAPWPSFDDLKVPFRAVATDIAHGNSVIFSQGDLAEAMRASMSLPLVFAPYQMDTMLLVDGGVVENIPVEISHAQGADFVIAVDISTGLQPPNDVLMPWELADRVSTIMHLDRNRTSRQKAGLVITPKLKNHKSTDFTGIKDLIEAGYEAAKESISELEAKLEGVERSHALPAVSFCARGRYEEFLRNIPVEKLPPKRYYYAGVSLPDSQVNSLPSGADGLTKLAHLRRAYLDDGRVMAHLTRIYLSTDSILYNKWDEGRILSIRAAGLQRYKPWMLLQEFPQKQGDLFDLRRATRGVSQIYGSGLYDSIFLSATPTDSGCNVTIRAQERSSPQLRVGAGFSSERRGRAFLEFLNDNALNIGARLVLFGKYGEKDEEARGQLAFDRFPLRTPIDALTQSYINTDISGYWRREENNFFDAAHRDTAFYFSERKGGEMWLGRSFRRWGQFATGLVYEHLRVGGVTEEPTTHNAQIAVRTLVDTKDSYPFPARGILLRAQYAVALRSWSQDGTFNKVTVLADIHQPLAHRLVLHGRSDYGWNDRKLKVWGQYFLGGNESLLGLHENERRGNVRLSVLGELRYDLVSRWLADTYVSLLYTTGGISEESYPFPESATYQHSVGAMFSLNTLLGPLSLTYGEILKSHSGHGLFYVNLGHNF
jgi:NTE family protein